MMEFARFYPIVWLAHAMLSRESKGFIILLNCRSSQTGMRVYHLVITYSKWFLAYNIFIASNKAFLVSYQIVSH